MSRKGGCNDLCRNREKERPSERTKGSDEYLTTLWYQLQTLQAEALILTVYKQTSESYTPKL